ncbi:MAG: proton-conducting membrane transporter [Oscillibacter sp.]|nr:proton-conducting membrane transporter [Oscillibacter sp.]
MLLFTVLFPIVAGVGVSLRPMPRRARLGWYAAIMLTTDALAVWCMFRAAPLRLFALTETLDFCFALDTVGRVFLSVVLLVYTAACFYAFEYMSAEEREEAFFAFYFASLGAVMAACMAGNLVTFYLCFELATLSSMPLVLHEGTKEAISAALKYLFYSIGGALLGLLAVVCLFWYGANANGFLAGGFLDPERVAGHEALLRAIVFLGIVGFGAKAGMYPLHGWLPAAHPIAPAPASALLSGIIAKLGVLGVIRLVYFSAGPALIRGTWVQYAWMCLAMGTIFMGSMMAFREKVMKKRLAYSSISQISYIMLGLSLLNAGGLTGGLLQFAAHAVSKGTLFLCAGVFIHKLGRRNASELRGAGQLMPVTMWCFLLASLSLVGIPPMGGFASKWYLSVAAVADGMGVFSILPPVILLVSAFLTAGYLLPVVVDAFFPGRDFSMKEAFGDCPAVQKRLPASTGKTKKQKLSLTGAAEPSALMTVPLAVLCTAALCVGLFGAWFAEGLGDVIRGLV